MVDARLRLALLVFLGVTSFACKKEGAGASPPDAAGAASPSPPPPAGMVEGDPLAQPERALAANADELRSLGIALEGDEAPKKREGGSPKPDDPMKSNDDLPAATRCDAICQLADTACELRTQICELAEDHVGESRYEAACWRATDQCTRASTACEDCRGSTAGAAGSCGRE